MRSEVCEISRGSRSAESRVRYSSKRASRVCWVDMRARRSDGGASPPYRAPDRPTSSSRSSTASSRATSLAPATWRRASAAERAFGPRAARRSPQISAATAMAVTPNTTAAGIAQPRIAATASGIQPLPQEQGAQLVDVVDGCLRPLGLVRPAEPPSHEDDGHAVHGAAVDVVVAIADEHGAVDRGPGRLEPAQRLPHDLGLRAAGALVGR